MRPLPWGLRAPWGVTAATAVLWWIACFVVFSGSCLSLGGVGSACHSLFDYPESLPVAAIVGAVPLIPVGLPPRVATFVAKRKPQA